MCFNDHLHRPRHWIEHATAHPLQNPEIQPNQSRDSFHFKHKENVLLKSTSRCIIELRLWNGQIQPWDGADFWKKLDLDTNTASAVDKRKRNGTLKNKNAICFNDHLHRPRHLDRSRDRTSIAKPGIPTQSTTQKNKKMRDLFHFFNHIFCGRGH